MAKRVFISFRMEDVDLVRGLRLMAKNPNFELEIYDESVKVPINSTNAAYIKSRIREKISRSGVVLCIVNFQTYASEWVVWELQTAIDYQKPIVAMAAKGISAGTSVTLPKPIESAGLNFYTWNPGSLSSYIDAARYVRR